MRTRIAGAAVLAMASATAILACSLRDTSYLNEGKPEVDGGNQPDVVAPNEGGGGSDAATRTSTVIADGQVGARLIIQDSTSVYWVNNDGKLVEVKKAGGDPRVVGDIGKETVELATDPSSPLIFFTTPTEVKSIKKADGTIATVGTTSPGPTGLAVDAKYVFAVADDDNTLSITRFMHDGSAKAVLYSTDAEFAKSIALDSDNVTWDRWDNSFASLPKESPPQPDGGLASPTITTVNTQDDETSITPRAFAVDKDAYYYSNAFDVRSMARVTSGKPTQLMTHDTTSDISAIAIDDQFVYAIDSIGAGTLQKSPKNGTSAPELLLSGLLKPTSLVVDATSVYITVQGPPGVVIKCPK